MVRPKDGEWSSEQRKYIGVTQHWQTLQEVIEAQFKGCKVYTTKGEALEVAHDMEAPEMMVEYGVHIESYDWRFGS